MSDQARPDACAPTRTCGFHMTVHGCGVGNSGQVKENPPGTDACPATLTGGYNRRVHCGGVDNRTSNR
ncbi:hypothetical protein [Endozoicomonas sp. ALC013]|uniref:hypothetical protein n=1 Tax=Endozoicomonas sp. ALC013 TaxID=3403076 RepID=UPI003BB697AF